MATGRRSDSFARRLGISIAVFDVFVVALAAWLLQDSYDLRREQAAVASSNIAEILDQNVAGIIDRVDLALLDVAGRFKQKGGRDSEIDGLLGELLGRLSDVASLGLANADGDVEVWTGPMPAVRANIGDRDYFKMLRDTPGAGLTITKPVQGRITGKWQIVLDRRLDHPDGSFGGAVYAVVMIEHFEKLFSRLNVGPHGAVVLLDGDLNLSARYPGGAGPYPVSEALRTAVAAHAVAGTYRAKAGPEQAMKTISYRRVGAYPLYVITSLADQDWLAEWRATAMGVAGLVALFLAATLWMARMAHHAWRQAEAALERIEELSDLNTAVIEAIPMGVLAYKAEGGCILANEAAARIVGGSVDQLRAQNFHDIEAWAATGMRAMAETALDTGERQHLDARYLSSFGRNIWIAGSFSRFVLGENPHLLLVCRDIADQKLAEETLRASEERYRGLIESQCDFIVRIDSGGRLAFVNDAFAHAFGRRPEDVISDLWQSYVHEDDVEATARALAEACRPPAYRATVESRMTMPSGPRWVAWEGGGIRDVDGRIVEVQAVGRDITEWVAYRERLNGLVKDLDTSNRELEQFAYVASHDLREPLRMISSYIGLLDRRYRDLFDDDGRDFLEFAREGAQRMDSMVLDLLEFSRVGRIGDPFVPVSLKEVSDTALNNLKLTVTESLAEITVAPDLPMVTGARGELVRLFQNLVGNAMKYRHPARAPRIAIGVEAGPHDWTVSVSDNGIGIAPEYFDRIFDIFQRLHTRKEYEGTGIGLAICRKIVHHHGGRIWVESKPDGGSTFLFTLPRQGKS